MRGRPPSLSESDRHELRRYREAGVSIQRLAGMWKISMATVYNILAVPLMHGQISALRQKLAALEATHDALEDQPAPADIPTIAGG